MDDRTISIIMLTTIFTLVAIIIYLLLFVKKSSSTTLPTSTIFPSSTPIPLPTFTILPPSPTATITLPIPSPTESVTIYNNCLSPIVATVHYSPTDVNAYTIYSNQSISINYIQGMYIVFGSTYGQYLGTVTPSPGQTITPPICPYRFTSTPIPL